MDTPVGAAHRRIVFLSSNHTWGGSEELWSAAAEVLVQGGHHIAICKANLAVDEPRLHRLRAQRCPMFDLGRLSGVPHRVTSLLWHRSSPAHGLYEWRVRRLLARARPDLIVVSQGANYDGVRLADICRRMGRPYVIIAQKADDMYWPSDAIRGRMRAVYSSARAVFFVASHNRVITEQQIGQALPHSVVVRNPYLVPRGFAPAWPSSERLRLACVGRLEINEKGQDLLLRVLSRPAWRGRDVSVTFFGAGPNADGLADLARYLDLASVTFGGFRRDIAAIWEDHHGLVLPSRCEGLPLVVVETMMSGRVPIATAVGGTPEVVDDNQTGFLAAAPTEDALDAAMTRAWQRRADWPDIGTEAARRIRGLVPASPEREFAARLLTLCAPGMA